MSTLSIFKRIDMTFVFKILSYSCFILKNRHITLNGNLTLDCKYSIERGNNST